MPGQRQGRGAPQILGLTESGLGIFDGIKLRKFWETRGRGGAGTWGRRCLGIPGGGVSLTWGQARAPALMDGEVVGWWGLDQMGLLSGSFSFSFPFFQDIYLFI